MWAFISVSHTPRHSHSAVTVQLYRVIILSSAFIRDIILELTLFEKHIGIQGRVQTAPPPKEKKKILKSKIWAGRTKIWAQTENFWQRWSESEKIAQIFH